MESSIDMVRFERSFEETALKPPSPILLTKCGKAAGIDIIHEEVLKADLNSSTKFLTDLFRKIWEKDTIPDDWNNGLIGRIDAAVDQKLSQKQAGFKRGVH